MKVAPVAADHLLRIIEGEGVDTAVEEAPPSPRGRIDTYPNPSSGTTDISITLSQSTHGTVRIYDLFGREVRTLVDAFRPAGEHVERWDGNDARGVPLGSGLYFVRVQTPHSVSSRGLIRVR